MASSVDEEMSEYMKRGKIKISNYVYTIRMKRDLQSSPRDPRICKTERCNYLPEPFATYVASLEHINTPGSKREPWETHDPYVFAMLNGLRSVSEETDDCLNQATSAIGRKKKRGKRARRNPVVEIPVRASKRPKRTDLWNSDPSVETASKQALRKGTELYGPQKHEITPFERFDLISLVEKFSDYCAKCNLPRFAAVILKTLNSSASCSLFAPLKAVNTGARTDGVGQYGVMKCLQFLRQTVSPLICPLGDSFKAQNVVAKIILPFRLDLDKLKRLYPLMVSYNSEMFPGVRIRAPQISPAAQLGFRSGRVVTMGGRSPDDHVRAYCATFSIFYNVRITDEQEEDAKEK